MKCPFCGHLDDKVVDSRLSTDGEAIRRRRECEACNKRFTSYERVEEIMPMVVKKDGRREPFDRLKVLSGLKKACEKRPISMVTLENTADEIEKKLLESAD
ncbi:MAG TPA: transcriptional regulator NrdR, partial [Nitrospirota bacterium]